MINVLGGNSQEEQVNKAEIIEHAGVENTDGIHVEEGTNIINQTPEQNAQQAKEIVDDPENKETLEQLSYVLNNKDTLPPAQQELVNQEVKKTQEDIATLYAEIKKQEGNLDNTGDTNPFIVENADRKIA